MNRRYLYIAGVIASVLVVFLVIGLVDLDGDHVNGFDEWFNYGTGPTGAFIYNPSLARSWDDDMVNSTLVKMVLPLESDGLSDNEAFLIDKAASIPDLVPSDTKQYYNAQEITEIQRNLLFSVTADQAVSQQETAALTRLTESNWMERWWIVRDIFKSGMISDASLSQDWDVDGKSNSEEIMQGTNPLNRLELDPNNLSQRYAVICAILADNLDSGYTENIAQLLKKNGYNDDNVYFIYNPGNTPPPEDPLGKRWVDMSNFPIKVDYVGNWANDSKTQSTFLEYLKNLPSDANDAVLVDISTHGPPDFICMGDTVFLSAERLNQALNQVTFGESILNIYACQSGAFGKKILNPNVLVISDVSETGTTGLNFSYLMEHLDTGISVKDAFNEFETQAHENNEYPVMYSNRDMPFMNPLVYIRM